MRELLISCELNVIAEFKKFDIHRLHRGIISRDCVEAVYEIEGIKGEELKVMVTEFMKHDIDHNDMVKYNI